MSICKKNHLTAAFSMVAMLAFGSVATADTMRSGSFIKTGSYSKSKTTEMKTMDSIVDVAVASGSFNTLVAAIQKAGLEETLRGEGPFTVFAPTDEAFSKVDSETLEALLADKDALTSVLTYHVVPGRVMASDVMNLEEAKTVNGQSIDIATESGVMVDNASVISTDILASNGVIHVIDSVILPN